MAGKYASTEVFQLENLETTASGTTTPGESKSEHPFNEQTNYLPVNRLLPIFLACASVDFLSVLDETALSASLYVIGDVLHASSQNGWIIAAYFVTSTTLLLSYGRLSDIWGRKVVLLSGLIIFLLGSLGSSVAQTSTQLIAFRAFTGVGGGSLVTISNVIIGDVATLKARGKYYPVWGFFIGLAYAIGPIIGGTLALEPNNSWRWIFRMNIVLALIAILNVIFLMPLKKVQGSWKTKLRAVDFVGAGIAVASIPALVIGMNAAGRIYNGVSKEVITMLVVGTILLALFFLWQWNNPRLPLIPLHIFKYKVVNGCSIIMFVTGWVFFVQMYYIPTYYRVVYGYTPLKAGYFIIPLTVIEAFSSTVCGIVIAWTGRYRESILIGWALCAFGMGFFSTLKENSSPAFQVGYATLTGFGLGMTLQPGLIAIQAAVSRKDMAVTTAFRAFSRYFGTVLGVAVAGTIFNKILINNLMKSGASQRDIHLVLDNPNKFIRLSLSGNPPYLDSGKNLRPLLIQSYIKGFRIVFTLGTVLAVIAFVVTFFLIPQIDIVRPDDEQLKQEGRAYDEALRRKANRKRAGQTGQAQTRTPFPDVSAI